ncbi:hypothetical protein C8R47DRAFT_1080449 [Mycena vitilis]|nr:hypothetical protein C8R47DRAFT_1080449 [Mycena vitilis]
MESYEHLAGRHRGTGRDSQIRVVGVVLDSPFSLHTQSPLVYRIHRHWVQSISEIGLRAGPRSIRGRAVNQRAAFFFFLLTAWGYQHGSYRYTRYNRSEVVHPQGLLAYGMRPQTVSQLWVRDFRWDPVRFGGRSFDIGGIGQIDFSYLRATLDTAPWAFNMTYGRPTLHRERWRTIDERRSENRSAGSTDLTNRPAEDGFGSTSAVTVVG